MQEVDVQARGGERAVDAGHFGQLRRTAYFKQRIPVPGNTEVWELLLQEARGGFVVGGLHLQAGAFLLHAVEVGQRALEAHPALVDDAHVGDHLLHFGEEVGGDEDGHPLLAVELLDQLPELDDAGGVEAVGGLVEHEQLGPGQEGQGNREALLHAEGEFLHRLLGRVVEPHNIEHLPDPFLRHAVHGPVDLEVLPGIEVAIERGRFNERTDFFEDGRAVLLQVLAEDLDLAFLVVEQAQ